MAEEIELVENATEGTTEQVENQSQPTESATEDTSQAPVTSLSEAKEVLKAQRAEKAEPKTDANNSPENLNYRKQYEEIQKVVGKQGRELSELRKFQKENQAMVSAWRKQQEEVQKQEFDKLAQSNPMAAAQQIARREAAQQFAPIQEMVVSYQAANINSSIQKQLGDKYEEYAPVMFDIIEKFEEMDAAQGTNYAQQLAQDHKSLIQLADKEFEKLNKANAQSISEQKKTNNLKIASGVAKTSNVKASSPVNFGELSLAEMTQQMKKMGILNR